MTDLNKVILIGRITKNIDENSFGYVGNGMARATTSIAVNRSKKQQDGNYTDEASFFDIQIWGKLAENLKQYLVKGQQIVVEGFLRQERWQDKQTQQNRSRISITAESIQLVGGKKDGNNGYQNQGYNQQQGYQQAPQQQYQQPQNNGYAQQPMQQQGYQQQDFMGEPFPEEIPF